MAEPLTITVEDAEAQHWTFSAHAGDESVMLDCHCRVGVGRGHCSHRARP